MTEVKYTTKKILVSKIKNTEPNRDHGDIGELKASIKDVGLLYPLIIDRKNKLLAGRRRIQAVKELGWKEVPVLIIDSEDDLIKMQVTIDENLKRKNLTDVEEAIQIKEYQHSVP